MAGIRKLLALAEPRGSVDALERVLGTAGSDVDAVAIVGDLAEVWSKPETYRAIFKTLGESGHAAFWVPGPNDAPLREYLSESHNLEIVFPRLRGVHGTLALSATHVLFAGMGGEIKDAPDTIRGEEYLIRYPGWEAEYRLKALADVDAHASVLLFATPPAHKGLGLPGSEVLAELVKTHRPAVVVAGGEEPREGLLGRTIFVAPGRLDHGHYAVVDLRARSVEAGRVEVPAPGLEPQPVADEEHARR